MSVDRLRNRTVGSKMTESEYGQLVAVAEGEGLTLGEWCRKVLLAHANSSELERPSATERTLLAELVALRMILLSALHKLERTSPAMRKLSKDSGPVPLSGLPSNAYSARPRNDK